MALGIFLSVAGLIKDPIVYVFSPLKRHISYAFRCDSKVQSLQGEAEKLKNKKDLLQQSVLEATRNGEEIHGFVTSWLSSAQNEIEEADELVQGKDEVKKKKCFAGFCPNLKSRYQLGKKAHKKALAVGKKLQDAPRSDPISFRPPLQQMVEPSVYTSEALPSRVLILNQIMAALEDPNLNMIGVYGMGGVGKTRLAKEVQRKAVEKKLFKDVILVAVSKTQDLRRIQGEIADPLGLKLDAEEVPGRAGRLHQRLEKANVLIILDDVWEKLDLNAVGIPFGDAAEGCKIFLTSRSKGILSSEMRTQKEFSLDVLKEEETLRLFEMSAGNIEDSELHHIATEIAKKCAGLPLLILKVAADLRNKDSYAWSDMLNQLSSLENTEIYEKVHKVIESSYEKLSDEQAKSLFLLCALFGNANIEIHKLLIYSVGLGLFKRIDSIEGSRNRVLTLIAKLKNESLLLDGDRAGFVKIHDVVRDISLAIASREQHAFVGTSKVRSMDLQNKDYTRISLPYADICKLPEVMECPEAELFSLFVKGDRLHVPDSFFQKVTKLKVVDLYRVDFLFGLPSSLCFLVGLHTLCLERCWFNNVAIVAELKQLEVLSFAESNIEELPRELRGLTRLKLLDLRGCRSLRVIPANVLSNLRILEELYILRTAYTWDAEGNASLVELKELPYLKTLEIEVNDDKLLPEDWFFNGVRNYKISIGDWPDYYKFVRYGTSRRILMLELGTRIGLMRRIKEFMGGIEVLELGDVKGVENLFYDGYELGKGYFGELRILKIKKCETLKSLFSPSFTKCLPQLQQVEVESCGSMEAVVGEGCEDEVIEFTELNSLRLTDLPSLVGLRKTSGMVSFPNLTILKMSGCKSMKYVFTTSMVEALKQLKELEIRDCWSMKEIVVKGREDEVVEFPRLTSVTLCDLPNLKSFSKTSEMVSFPNLTSLDVFGCNSMKYVFTTSMVESLKQLKELEIRDCGLMEEIVGEGREDEVVEFPRLTSVTLSNLPNLKSFSKTSEMVCFPNLTSLDVDNCYSMKYVFTTSMVKSLKQLEDLRVSDSELMEEIIKGDKFEEKEEGGESSNRIVFPELYRLTLYRLRSLKRFSSGYSIDFPSLRKLRIGGCNAMENFLSKVSNGSNTNGRTHRCLFNQLVCFPNLTSFDVFDCKSLKYVFTTSMVKSLKQLEKLWVSDCELMEEIIKGNKFEEKEEAGESSNRIVFPKLYRLKLYGLRSLKRFSSGYSIDFPSLRELRIKGCNAMENFLSEVSNGSNANVSTHRRLFNQLLIRNVEELELDGHGLKALQGEVELPLNLKTITLTGLRQRDIPMVFGFLRRIDSLELLIFRSCNFVLDDDERDVGEEEQKYHVTLKQLKLNEVSILKHILKEDSPLNPVLQHLHSISVEHCDNLMNIAQSSASFQNLTTLHVGNCHEMTSLVTASTAKTMVQLVELKVSSCRMMEEIVAKDSGCTEHDVIIFNNLRLLKLEHLHRLNSFCSGNYNFSFPLLEQATVNGCSRMKTFCSGNLSTPKLLRVEFNRREEQWKGDLNATISCELREWVGEPILPHQMKVFNGLRKLVVRDCNWVDAIFNLEELSAEHGNVNLLPELNELELINLPMLTQLCNKAPRGILELKKLRVLKIENCSKLVYAFTWSMASCLFELQEIEVKNCEMMETIIKGEEAEVVAAQVRLGLLEYVTLERLPKFSSFYSGRGDLECPLLRQIVISECPTIKVLTMEDKVFSHLEELFIDIKFLTSIMQFELPSNFFSNLKALGLVYSSGSTITKSHVPLLHFLSILPNLHRLGVYDCSVQELFKFEGLSCSFTREATSKLSQVIDLTLYKLQSLETLEVISCGQIVSLASSAASFQNLTRLKVYECNQLRNLITASVAKSMVQLETLKVQSCKMLMEIVGHGNDGTNGEIVFTKLNTLKLIDLESLEGFCLGNYAFEFPCLENVIVRRCPNMRIFCPGIIQAPMLTHVEERKRKFDGRSGYWEGDLNSTIKHLYKKMVGFEGMTYLKLSQFPGLKEQWAAQFPLGCFISLERLVVDDCAVFSSAISSHLLHRLEKLKELVVEKCDSVEQVFDLEGLNYRDIEMENLKELHLIDLPRLRDAWSKIPREILSFENLQLLRVYNCGNLTRIFDLSMALSLPELQHLEVKNCNLLKHIIVKEDEESTMQQQFQTIFPSLQTMNLQYLTNFSSFYSTSGFLKCPSLRFVEVVQCPKMGLFASPDSCMIIKENKGKITAEDSHSMAAFLGNTIKIPKLEELKVEWDSLMVELNNNNQLEFLSGLKLIHLTGFDGECAILPPQLIQNFPQLKKLTLSDASMEEINLDELIILHNERAESVGLLTALMLSNLPKLKHLVSDDSQPVALFQKLEDLEVSECSRLSILVPSLVSFQNLTSLQVTKCDGMKNLITASTARSLVQLKRMNVKDCKMMQEIVAIDSDRVEYEIRFSLLEHLELDQLPCLASFCSGDYDLFFPSLVEMVVIDCPSMKIFAEKDSDAPKLWKVQTGRRDYEWEWEGGLNNTIEALFREKDAEEMDA